MADDKKEVDEVLTVDKLLSGDRPSLYAFGMTGAHSIRSANLAIFMVDVLGRVHIMPPEAVEVKRKPRVSEEDLNSLSVDKAIEVLVTQGDTEEQILTYLRRRPKES